MALDPTLEEQELLADTLSREHSAMTHGERLAGLISDAGLIAAIVALWLARPVHEVHLWPLALCMLVLVLASRVSFDTPFGFTVLTQLAFVPLLFAAPPSLVPVAVAIALTVARVPDVLGGKIPAARLLQSPGNAWFAVGPAAVFVIAGRVPADAGAVLMLAALLAEFALDFAISTLRYRLSRGASLRSQLRETWVYGIDAGLSGVALVVAARVPHQPAVVLSLIPVLALFAVLAKERRERLESLLELNAAYRGTALVLGDVVEADDGYTGEHCKSVVALTLDVATQMQLNAEQRRNLEFAALLHDVGKIAVPKEIINKPGSLSTDEWTIIKTHTTEGQKILERVGGFMREVGLVVRSHHERWDGTGYPDGLAGEAIPLEARIISCCDTWNAMRTDRSYRRALSKEAALAELRANSASQFDPTVVEALLAVVDPPVADEAPDVLAASHESARAGGEAGRVALSA